MRAMLSFVLAVVEAAAVLVGVGLGVSESDLGLAGSAAAGSAARMNGAAAAKTAPAAVPWRNRRRVVGGSLRRIRLISGVGVERGYCMGWGALTSARGVTAKLRGTGTAMAARPG